MNEIFKVEYYTRSRKDLEKLKDSKEALKIIEEVLAVLEKDPFPYTPRKKRIQGISKPLYRLRIDTSKDSYRIFYTLSQRTVVVLRVVKKKDAEKIIRSFR